MAKKKRPKNNKMDTKKMSVLIIFLVLAIFAVSIAYSALSQSLNITATSVTESALTWNVAFQTGSVTGVEGGSSSSSGRSCGVATVTANSVSVATTTLSKPDDSCTYALTINNTGTIDAILGTITAVNPTSTSCTSSGASMVCGNITYLLSTSSSGSPLLTTGGTLAKTSGTLNLYLVIKYTGSTVSEEDMTQSNGGFTLVYNQA